MWKWLLFFVIIFTYCRSFSQETALPVIKKGIWSLVDTNGNTITTTDYQYIDIFDQLGTAYFSFESKYGILNSKGQELIPAQYIDVMGLGHGVYALKDSANWNIVQVLPTVKTIASNISKLPEKISDKWISFYQDELQSICFLPTQWTHVLDSNFQLIEQKYEYLFFRKNKTFIEIHSPENIQLVGDNLNYSIYNNFLLIHDAKLKTVVDSKGNWEIPENQFTKWSVNIRTNSVFIGDGNAGTLYEISSRQILYSGKFDVIGIENEARYFVVKDGFYNLIDRKNKALLFPMKYVAIQVISNGYITYLADGKMTIYSSKFEPLLSDNYDNVKIAEPFIYVCQGPSWGVYSLIAKKVIVPCLFSTIKINGSIIKAYRTETISAFKLNEKHEVIDQFIGENPVFLSGKNTLFNNDDISVDPRLFPLGWYRDSIDKKKGSTTEKVVLWGLRFSPDSILLAPRYSKMKYVVGPFSFSEMLNQSIKCISGDKFTSSIYSAINYSTGRVAGTGNYIYIDTTDFEYRNFIRTATSKNVCLLYPDGTSKKIDFIQSGQDELLRYCKDGQLEIEDEENSENIAVNECFYTINTVRFNPSISSDLNNLANRVLYKGAKWNFLTQDGENLFSEDFEYANPFVGNHAIVNRNGKWGVVTKDSVLIPFIFNKIERKITLLDTLFITEKAIYGNRFLDTSLTVQPNFTSFIKAEKQNSVIQTGEKQLIINQNYTQLAEPSNYIKLFANGFFSIKNKKEYLLYSAEGEQLLQTDKKIKEAITNQYFLVEDGAMQTIINFNGDPLVTDKLKEFELYGRYLWVKTNLNQYLFDTIDGAKRFECKSGKILVDSKSGQFIHTENGKTKIYSSVGVITGKLKNIDPLLFYNSLIFCLKPEVQAIDTKGVVKLKFDKLDKTTIKSNGYFAVKTDQRGWLIYDENWNEIQPKLNPIRSYNYHGNNIFSFKDKTGETTLVNFNTQQRKEHLTEVYGSIEFGSLMVKSNKNVYFIKENLQPLNRFKYIDATPFYYGFAAVKDQRGWTIIDTANHMASYPSFPELKPLGAHVYACTKQTKFGMYNCKGELIIPSEVEKIKMVTPTIFQVILNGEIFYFKRNGQKLFH